MINFDTKNFTGAKTTSHSQSEGRLKVDAGDKFKKNKKRKIIKKVIKKSKYGY